MFVIMYWINFHYHQFYIPFAGNPNRTGRLSPCVCPCTLQHCYCQCGDTKNLQHLSCEDSTNITSIDNHIRQERGDDKA